MRFVHTAFVHFTVSLIMMMMMMMIMMMMMMICLSAGQACPKGWQKYGQSCFYMPGDIRD